MVNRGWLETGFVRKLYPEGIGATKIAVDIDIRKEAF